MSKNILLNGQIYENISKLKVPDSSGELVSFVEEGSSGGGSNFRWGIGSPDGDGTFTVSDLGFQPAGFMLMAIAPQWKGEGTTSEEGNANQWFSKPIDTSMKEDNGQGPAIVSSLYFPSQKLATRGRPHADAKKFFVLGNPSKTSNSFTLTSDGFKLNASSDEKYRCIKGQEYFWCAWA